MRDFLGRAGSVTAFRCGPKLTRRIRRQPRGGAILELAIAVPVLLLLVIGVADFGRMFYTGIAVANAARATAEFAAASITNTAKDTAILNQIGRDEAADIAPILITTEKFCRCPDGTTPACDGLCPAPDTWVEVFMRARAVKTINLILRYPGIPQTITFRDSATFRAQ